MTCRRSAARSTRRSGTCSPAAPASSPSTVPRRSTPRAASRPRINGTTAGGNGVGLGYPQLTTNGPLDLGGTLTLSKGTAFTPVDGQTFTLASAASRTGAFDNIVTDSTFAGWFFTASNTASFGPRHDPPDRRRRRHSDRDGNDAGVRGRQPRHVEGQRRQRGQRGDERHHHRDDHARGRPDARHPSRAPAGRAPAPARSPAPARPRSPPGTTAPPITVTSTATGVSSTTLDVPRLRRWRRGRRRQRLHGDRAGEGARRPDRAHPARPPDHRSRAAHRLARREPLHLHADLRLPVGLR